MKYRLLIVCLAACICVFNSCKKNKIDIYEKIAGLWIPYELANESGTIQIGPFTANSFFGSYAESVQLNADKTFIPVIWFDANNFGLKNDESGKFEFKLSNKLLFRGGLFGNLEFEITRFEADELWLKMYNVTYRFRRQS